jgi:hypothetical protein
MERVSRLEDWHIQLMFLHDVIEHWFAHPQRYYGGHIFSLSLLFACNIFDLATLAHASLNVRAACVKS